jgi:hypothetical protein
MHKVISILESIASNAALKHATPRQLQALLEAEVGDGEVLVALQQQNVYQLETVLNARTGLICGVLPAEEPLKEPEQEPEPTKEPEEDPEQAAIHNISLLRSVG